MSNNKIKIHFIITGLESGGAENMLYKLLSLINKDKFSVIVTSLLGEGVFGRKIRDLGIELNSLGMDRGSVDFSAIFRMAKLIKKSNPNIVQTWMYHADLIGGISAKIAKCSTIVWNIRNGTLDTKLSKKSTILTTRACSFLSSHIPKKIVCCAESAKEIHSKIGYSEDRIVVIPNGFDVDVFRPDSESRARVRSALGISDKTIVIGLAGRFDPQKDHKSFFLAASKISKIQKDIRFILCGNGIFENNLPLFEMIQSADVAGRVNLLGRRDDMAQVTAAFDIGCSSSAYGEAFSNTIGESMACGVPCVVTDVGDSAVIVGDSGLVVPPRDPEALFCALKEMVEMGAERRRELGVLARQRVIKEYSLEGIVLKYEGLYSDLFASAAGVAVKG